MSVDCLLVFNKYVLFATILTIRNTHVEVIIAREMRTSPTTFKMYVSLQCFANLTQWENLEKFSVLNIDDSESPDLDKVWTDTFLQVSI